MTLEVKTKKLVAVSLAGLTLNAVFNGFYILLIARESDSELLAQSMVMWGGFFVAGACIAPFENYRLYRRMGDDHEQSHGKVLVLSSFLFLSVGLSIKISQDGSWWTLPFTLVIGLCIGLMVNLRASSISQGELRTVSISNAIEGFVRCVAITFCTIQFETLTFLQILISYMFGNIASLVPYFRKENIQRGSKLESIPTSRLYGLAAIGLSTSLITGGLPYMAGYFETNSISTILFFYTLGRSLLIIMSVLVYVRPQLAKDFGEKNSFIRLIKLLTPLLLLLQLLLMILKYALEVVFKFDLSQLGTFDLFLFAISINLNGYFALRIAATNVAVQLRKSLQAACLSLFVALLSFTLIDSSKIAFYSAMILGPLAGILALAQRKG
jgi:hypothetical protein